MEPNKFAVGDRVIAISESDGNASIVGVVGTVVEVCSHIFVGLAGTARVGYGWYTDVSCLELYKEPEIPADVNISYDEVMI